MNRIKTDIVKIVLIFVKFQARFFAICDNKTFIIFNVRRYRSVFFNFQVEFSPLTTQLLSAGRVTRFSPDIVTFLFFFLQKCRYIKRRRHQLLYLKSKNYSYYIDIRVLQKSFFFYNFP